MDSKSGNKITLSFEPSKKIFKYLTGLSPLLTLLLAMFVFSSCARSINDNIDRGSNYLFRAGYPEVRMTAIGLFDEAGNAGINVTANVVYGSLIYKEVNNKQTARVAIQTRIVKVDDKVDKTVSTDSYNVTVTEDDMPNVTTSQETFTFHNRYPVESGSYTVYVRVVDITSKRQTTRRFATDIPLPNTQKPVLTNIQLQGKDNEGDLNGYSAIATYDVQSEIDSLKFVFQVTNPDPNSPVTISSRLLRFKSDTTIARPMSYPEPSPSSIEYKGIEYDQSDLIQSSRRVLKETGSVLVEFIFPMQERGNYRFSARIDNEENEELFKARDFGIKSEHYPTLKTPRELARPLAYLMNEDEYEGLLKIKDPDSLKQRIDTFWLKNIGNKSTARQTISLYYQRVEEANKQFSNFKEGWKTDPGMMYILFGRPLHYDQYINSMIWFYTYNRGNPRESFQFDKPKLRTSFFPFDHYILTRNFFYKNIEYQQQQIWLNGLILQGY